GAKNGEAVVAEITDYRPDNRNPEGRIVEVLGDPNSLQVQTDMVIRKLELPHAFAEAALAQAEALDGVVRPEAGRADLREVLHVTIDGEDARDFDDAVAVVKSPGGYRLYVSIADVSHYVTPGSPLDLDAFRRGTSVYFPTRVVPMLPERLSNDLCSLVPDQDRYAFTAILDFDRKGNRIGKQFTKSLIRSHRRLTYTKVRQVLVDQDPAMRKELKGLLTPLKCMGELAAEIEKQRMARGSIGFELPEAKVEIGEDDQVTGIIRLERNRAHKLIEEFMLAANEAVAETFAQRGMPSLYRIHEPPDPIKVSEFVEFGRGMGLALPTGSGSPAWFGKVIGLVVGTPQEYIVNNLLLRTMQQARYSPDNVGHFGLAAEYYTHFTSPIRRYPDLMVHRALSKLLAAPEARVKSAADQAPVDTLVDAGAALSKRERVAVDAEREVVDRLKVRFMAQRIDSHYDGVVAGVTSFGLFVELIDIFVNGAVAIGDLNDDYYHHDERHHRLVGKRTNKCFQIGDLVRVRVASVEPSRRHINFDNVRKLEPGERGRGEAADSSPTERPGKSPAASGRRKKPSV
ncbi:MAG: ribonuclease R, partial [Desulfobulbaceae bacterium]|nr:ribonuclease R [Desulfobulbaceae bacterium]